MIEISKTENILFFIFNNIEYKCIIDACSNPLCHCKSIHLLFIKKSDENSEQIKFHLNLKTRKIEEKRKPEEKYKLFADTFLSELAEYDYSELENIHYNMKMHYTENSDDTKLKIKFDWMDIEYEQTLIVYNQILRYGVPLFFDFENIKYRIWDYYCLNTRCTCTEIIVALNDYYKGNIIFSDIKFDLKKNYWDTSSVSPKSKNIDNLIKALKCKYPVEIFLHRYRKLKTLYYYYLKRNKNFSKIYPGLLEKIKIVNI